METEPSGTPERVASLYAELEAAPEREHPRIRAALLAAILAWADARTVEWSGR